MNLPSYERRALPAGEVRMEAREDGSPLITGYAAVFDSDSQDLGGFIETIAPGAFKRSLEGGADVRGLANHDPKLILGRRSAGTLRLFEDAKGLRYEIDPPDTTAGRDMVESIRRGDITGSSFAFATVSDAWDFPDDEKQPARRTLREVHLFDVGPVTFPAYPDATTGLRSLEAARAALAPPPAPEPEPEPAEPAGPTPHQTRFLRWLTVAGLG